MLRRFGLIFLLASAVFADTLGYFEQRFNAIHFERGKWSREEKGSCALYTSKADGATVELMRMGTNNLVPFRGGRGLSVKVCGSTAAFEEGFESASKN